MKKKSPMKKRTTMRKTEMMEEERPGLVSTRARVGRTTGAKVGVMGVGTGARVTMSSPKKVSTKSKKGKKVSTKSKKGKKMSVKSKKGKKMSVKSKKMSPRKTVRRRTTKRRMNSDGPDDYVDFLSNT